MGQGSSQGMKDFQERVIKVPILLQLPNGPLSPFSPLISPPGMWHWCKTEWKLVSASLWAPCHILILGGCIPGHTDGRAAVGQLNRKNVKRSLFRWQPCPSSPSPTWGFWSPYFTLNDDNASYLPEITYHYISIFIQDGFTKVKVGQP